MTQYSNEQEIFNTVYGGLEKQGFIKSISPEYENNMWDSATPCRYRGANGCRCAAGHVMPDEAYRDIFEGFGVKGVKYFVDNFSENQLDFLRGLQFAHDFAESPEDMKNGLINKAQEYGLVV